MPESIIPRPPGLDSSLRSLRALFEDEARRGSELVHRYVETDDESRKFGWGPSEHRGRPQDANLTASGSFLGREPNRHVGCLYFGPPEMGAAYRRLAEQAAPILGTYDFGIPWQPLNLIEEIWNRFVHSLGWERRHPLIRTQRNCWIGPCRFPYPCSPEYVEKKRRELGTGIFHEALAQQPDSLDYFYSDLKFPSLASVYAIDCLLDRLTVSHSPNGDGPSPPTRSVSRLSISGNVAMLDGKPYGLNDAQAAFVMALVNAGVGVVVPGHKMGEAIQPRPDRIFNKLPDPIRELIDSKPGSGYTLLT